MDGNGRWAKARGGIRLLGHEAGAETVRRVIRASKRNGIRYLTLYAFSVENWKRPADEVGGLMKLLVRFLKANEREFHENQIRLRVQGRKADLPESVRDALAKVEEATKAYSAATLILALSYGGRDEITDAVRKLAQEAAAGSLAPERITAQMISDNLYLPDVPDPDLIVRTSGEIRLSNFLLWQCAYSEFYFTDTLWPDFSEADFDAAVAEYERRHRRFGGL
jgi:undecaprenyl diphosphate synthase